MIRGLRIRPWLLEQRERNPGSISHLLDCERCMREQDPLIRQTMGCGYLPPPPSNIPVRPWDGSSLGREIRADERDEKGRIRLPVCPGYVCSLPEVLEASWAHEYWKNGELTQFCEGQSTPQLRDAIHILASEQSQAQAWASKNPKGG